MLTEGLTMKRAKAVFRKLVDGLPPRIEVIVEEGMDHYHACLKDKRGADGIGDTPSEAICRALLAGGCLAVTYEKIPKR